VVLAVGGIKEKVLGAKHAGIREVTVPAENEPNAKEDLQSHMIEGLTLHFVRGIDQALEIALGPIQPATPTETKRPGQAKEPRPSTRAVPTI